MRSIRTSIGAALGSLAFAVSAAGCGVAHEQSAAPATSVLQMPVATSTTLSRMSSAGSLEPSPFETIAPAGAYPVIRAKLGERLPDDLPPGHYRVRLEGQDGWPEECLGELIVPEPFQSVPKFDPGAPTAVFDDAAAMKVEEARRKEYERICTGYTFDPESAAKLQAMIDAVGPNPVSNTGSDPDNLPTTTLAK